MHPAQVMGQLPRKWDGRRAGRHARQHASPGGARSLRVPTRSGNEASVCLGLRFEGAGLTRIAAGPLSVYSRLGPAARGTTARHASSAETASLQIITSPRKSYTA